MSEISVVAPVAVAPVPWFSTIDPAYLVGGTAELTLRRKSDGKAHTYQIRKFDGRKGVVYFVDYFVEGSWHYVGVFNLSAKHETETLVVTKNAKFAIDSVPVKVFQHFVIQLLFGVALSENFELSHGNVCSCCGRPLKTTKSLHDGIGPTCKNKVKEALAAK